MASPPNNFNGSVVLADVDTDFFDIGGRLIFWRDGDPNGAGATVEKGSLCFDYATPAIWQKADAPPSTVWNLFATVV